MSIPSEIDYITNFDYFLLDSPDFKEDSVREELIMPILRALRYGPSGINTIIRSKSVSHPFVYTGTTRRQLTSTPDYLLSVNSNFVAVLDAKAPGEEIKTGAHVEQVYSYATHPEIRVSLFGLCNGREFILFDPQQREPLLWFPLREIRHHWEQMEAYLAPHAVATQLPTSLRSPVRPERSDFDYLAIRPPREIVVFQKQTARRHFGVHPYFTKQVWSVVQHYISTFTKLGDLVLDPFGGSGVTAVEAVMLGRRAIHIDLNPLSVFIVKNLIEPINLRELAHSVASIKRQFAQLAPQTQHEISEALQTYDFPRGIPLPEGSDVATIEKLFSKRQLAHLALLKHLILQEPAELRGALLLMFSGLLNKVNLTYHSSEGRSEGRGDSAIFRYYRYRIAPDPAEVDIMKYFESRFKKVVAAKTEIAGLITHETIRNVSVSKGTATDLGHIPDESVDYIYTDPPYGAKIPYLDLSVMWTSWLDLPVSEQDYAQEAIEGGEYGKSQQQYSELLSQSIMEMSRVLKVDRWMSFVFAHKTPSYWHLILESAEGAGFEYAGAVKQSNGQTSFKKRQHPFTVLSGQLIINFRKVRNPRSIAKISLGKPVLDAILETVERLIALNHGATLEQINDELVIRGLESNFLDVLAREYEDLTPLLKEHFDYDPATKLYQLRRNDKFKSHIPLNLRIRYFLVSYLRRMASANKKPTFDDIVLSIMPLLKNGITPEHQTIQGVLETVAERVGTDRWRLICNEAQGELFSTGLQIPSINP